MNKKEKKSYSYWHRKKPITGPGAAESSSRILIARGAAIADVAHAADQHLEVRLRLTFLLPIAPKLTFTILGRARKARGMFATNCKDAGRQASIKMRSFIGKRCIGEQISMCENLRQTGANLRANAIRRGWQSVNGDAYLPGGDLRGEHLRGGHPLHATSTKNDVCQVRMWRNGLCLLSSKVMRQVEVDRIL